MQLKSAERAGEAPRIKLSAVKHLMDADLPAAIVVLEYGNGGRLPTRSLIVPVDAPIIYNISHKIS